MTKSNKKIVLHITPHLGGGVGSVLLNYLALVKDNPDFIHQLLSLEYANEKAQQASKETGFFLKDKMSSDHEGILNAVAQADIVLIHWWNHPLLNAFLVRETLPPSRIIFWSHISGFHAPYVFTEPALTYPDLFVFTSPLSFETPEVKALSEIFQKRLRHIWSTGGVGHISSIRPKPHGGFNVGYIGTVDYGKIHPRFLHMSSNIKIPGVKFTVCGGPNEKQFQEEASRNGIGERFLFTGKINDITRYLSEFDIFGYPLAPYHYGTCEQSLGEAMAAGVPPVVMANPTEAHIVKDGTTGIIARDEGSYSRAIDMLYHNKELRQRISLQARNDARQRFSLELMADCWEKTFDEALNISKSRRAWKGIYKGRQVSPARIFLESLGKCGKEFAQSLTAVSDSDKKIAMENIRRIYQSSGLWKAATRGTPNHYHYFFPGDETLKFWVDLYE